MGNKEIENLLVPYNPWWYEGKRKVWYKGLPHFRRLIVDEILSDIWDIKQVLSINGPRRVGKTTALHHIIASLINDYRHKPETIIYFSFDDPEVLGFENVEREIFDSLVSFALSKTSDEETPYLFLDEIQRLPKWELYIKKYYDLKTPVRFILSGSASSVIFRKSQESLLGRIKDRRLLPFSFKEFCIYKLKEPPVLHKIRHHEQPLKDLLLDGDKDSVIEVIKQSIDDLEGIVNEINGCVINYCQEGGFPEIWEIPSARLKIEYIVEQHIRKVLYEDMVTAGNIRRPETVSRFFVYLLSRPGIEINMTNVAKEIAVSRKIIEENLPRLLTTNLLFKIDKFSHQALRVRQGNIKCYPTDFGLRNAVLKTWEDFTNDPKTMGYYAENVVGIELIKWQEAIEISYYREDKYEVDFIVSYSANKHLPVEVKYRSEQAKLTGLKRFMKNYKIPLGVVITKEREVTFKDGILYIPLLYFLLLNQ